MMSPERKPVFTDPIELAVMIAEKNGWQQDSDSEEGNVALIAVPGRYIPVMLTLRWSEMADILMVRIYRPLDHIIPNYALSSLCRLLNLLNGRTLVGAWYYEYNPEFQDDAEALPLIVWRHELHVDQCNMPNDIQMESIMKHARVAHDTFYPCLVTFLSAKPVMEIIDGQYRFRRLSVTPEDAVKLLDESAVIGRA